ncbi:hypothetical protein AAGW04_16660 [Pectobacterium aroidearum]|uniref:hypothetical protein n=1 Tax=Pectobacterium aroidearum TaxID=1201031 RepID=UPI00315861A5
MGRKLYQEDLINILDIINEWEERSITWDSICIAVSCRLKKVLTRQCLARHPEIVSAYTLAKQKNKIKEFGVKDVHFDLCNTELSKLKNDNLRLRKENERLLIVIRNLQLVAYSRGVREEQIMNT